MNKLILSAITFFSLHCYAQETHNYSEFQIKSQGTVYITESDSLTGEIYYNELTSARVMLTDSAGKERKYLAKDILGFKIQNPLKTFCAIKSDGLDKSMLFYENVTPSNGEKLLLIKSFTSEGLSGAVVVNEMVTGKWSVSIYDKVQRKIMGTSLKKIAEIVKDCPMLYQKINSKEVGYSYGFIAPPLILERVYRNIVTDYNACNVKR